jgi:GntR family transcriptional repressor for pyruvate dehydrogenase complex
VAERGFVVPLRTTRTFEAAIESIVEGIERARLRSGDRLPTETELALQLGISKPTLRQALRILENVGLLSVRPGKGGGIFLVSELVPAEALSRRVAMEEDAVVDVLCGRRVLEAATTALAMHEAAEEDYEEIERTITLLEEHLGDRSSVIRIDAMFHRAVVRASHNQTVAAAMAGLWRDMAPIRDVYRGGEETDAETLDVHRAQLAAMREGDLVVLNGVLHEHFLMLEETFAKAIGRGWDELFGAIAAPMLEVAGAEPVDR